MCGDRALSSIGRTITSPSAPIRMIGGSQNTASDGRWGAPNGLPEMYRYVV